MPKITPWPMQLLTPAHPGFTPSGGIRVGSPALSGLQLFDNLDGGPIWKARLLQIPIDCREKILAAQLVEGLALSGVGLFSIPRYPRDRSPGADFGALGVPHSDGSSFDDGSLYAGSSVSFEFVGDHDLFDAEVVVSGVPIRPFIGGEEFSVFYPAIGHRMHRIMGIEEVAPGSYIFEISPPLRADTADGTELEFDRPECTMRMTNPETFLGALDYNRRVVANAEFEEAFW